MKGNNLSVVHKSEGDIITKSEETLYEVLKKLPSPKKEFNLSKDQKKWWYWFGREFLKTNQITQLDLIHLKKAAFWMDAGCQAYDEINKKGYDGLVQKFKGGATNITGHVSVIEKADKHLGEVSAHFGLSIKDRAKLKATTERPDNQLNFLDALKMLDNKSAQ